MVCFQMDVVQLGSRMSTSRLSRYRYNYSTTTTHALVFFRLYATTQPISRYDFGTLREMRLHCPVFVDPVP
jgi:hypothetical protein